MSALALSATLLLAGAPAEAAEMCATGVAGISASRDAAWEPRSRRVGLEYARRTKHGRGGVLLAKPDKYNIRAAADFTESTSGTGEVATGKVSVSVPSSLLGF